MADSSNTPDWFVNVLVWIALFPLGYWLYAVWPSHDDVERELARETVKQEEMDLRYFEECKRRTEGSEAHKVSECAIEVYGR